MLNWMTEKIWCHFKIFNSKFILLIIQKLVKTLCSEVQLLCTPRTSSSMAYCWVSRCTTTTFLYVRTTQAAYLLYSSHKTTFLTWTWRLLLYFYIRVNCSVLKEFFMRELSLPKCNFTRTSLEKRSHKNLKIANQNLKNLEASWLFSDSCYNLQIFAEIVIFNNNNKEPTFRFCPNM